MYLVFFNVLCFSQLPEFRVTGGFVGRYSFHEEAGSSVKSEAPVPP